MRKKPEHDRFPIIKRGYDPEAVEQHLEEIAATTDETLDEAAQQIVALESQIEELQRNEEAVQLTILAATETKEKMLAVAGQQADALREDGRKAGDGIITEARMQAFQVVTEARKEAESIVAEAIVEAALVARSSEPGPAPVTAPSDREHELEAQVARMQAVIADMEAQLLSRSASPGPEATDPEPVDETLDQEHEEESAPPLAESGLADDPVDGALSSPQDDDEDLEIVMTDTAAEESADVAHEVDADDADPLDPEAPAFGGVRRSFYSRRSAKLPRIGDQGGRGAMAAVAGLRPHFTPEEADEDTDQSESHAETEETPKFETV